MSAAVVTRTCRWRPATGVGLEHLSLVSKASGHTARAVVVAEADGGPMGFCYEIRLAADWTFRSLELETTDGRHLALDCDGGAWRDRHGRLPALAGCIDVDVSATPFTNTLPIRRVPFAVGETRRFDMAWVDAASPTVRRDGQIYTRLDASGRYRFAAADGSFAAELVVDDDGLVLSYPPLFQRL